jgi:hypothetical protein
MSRTRKSPRLLLAAFLVVLVTVIAAGARTPDRARQKRVLPDGTEVIFQGITEGPVHRFQAGGVAGRLFGSFLPDSVRDATGVGVYSGSPTDPGVTAAWFTAKSPPGAARTTGMEYVWMVFDEAGCETQLQSWGGQATGPFSLPLPAIPRHGSRAGLRIYERVVNARSRPVAQFWLPPSTRAKSGDWGEHVLPVTVRDGDVDYTLRRFVSGASSRSADKPPRYGEPTDANTHLVIAATRRGRPASDWMPVSLQLEDATGNRFTAAGDYATPRRSGSVTHLLFWQNLFPEEPTWRIRAEVARTCEAAFRPDEVFTLRGVPTPARGVFGPLNYPIQKARVNGVEVECSGVSWTSHGPPYAAASVMLPGRRLAGTRVTLVKAVDDSGRPLPLIEIPTIREFNWDNLQRVDFLLPFEIKKPMKSVDLTFAVHHTRSIEFLASPTRPAAPAAPGQDVSPR